MKNCELCNSVYEPLGRNCTKDLCRFCKARIEVSIEEFVCKIEGTEIVTKYNGILKTRKGWTCKATAKNYSNQVDAARAADNFLRSTNRTHAKYNFHIDNEKLYKRTTYYKGEK